MYEFGWGSCCGCAGVLSDIIFARVYIFTLSREFLRGPRSRYLEPPASLELTVSEGDAAVPVIKKNHIYFFPQLRPPKCLPYEGVDDVPTIGGASRGSRGRA